MSPELAQVRADLYRARRRVRDLQRQEEELVVSAFPCPLCKAKVGQPCGKPSGGGRPPHRERQAAAT